MAEHNGGDGGGGVPRVVILGAGFAGLNAAKALRRSPVRVTVIDRRNHHLFQPLLYQVATAVLSPADIASPVRHVLSGQRNARVLLAEAVGIDAARREVILRDGREAYDYLIVATGATHSYFGRDEWSAHAPGLKSIEDALEIRRRFLLAFEAAEREPDEAARRAALTFVVVGAGPTGVELAGAMIEIARRAIPHDFRAIDTTTARVVLVEAQDRVLTAFPPDLSARARASLESLGVEVRVSTRVVGIDARGVSIRRADADDAPIERIEARNVLWAAGVLGSPLAASLGVPLDHAGRVRVEPDLSVPGHPEIFVLGDLACVCVPGGAQVPGVCPAAVQMGKFAARVIAREARGRSGRHAAARPSFRYRDKGNLATIGRARAVAELGRFRFSGLPAWLLWAGVHIFFLIGFRNRLIVMIQWAWAYLVFERGARLITGAQLPPPPDTP